MTRLNQILAISSTTKNTAEGAFTNIFHLVQKPAPFSGLTRRYEPAIEGGEMLPNEQTKVQTTVDDQLGVMRGAWTRYFNVVAQQEWANRHATADVVVDGQVIIADAPVVYLLFLERKLSDLRNLVMKLPTLDPAEKWSRDTSGLWATDEAATNRTKKVPRNHVKAEATDRHPAQVEMYYEDVIVGTWKRITYSGMLPASQVRTLLERVEKLQRAVKMAREDANATTVQDDLNVGEAFFDYLLGA